MQQLQAQQKTQPILDEINREVGSLSLDEQKVLAQMPEYQMAKQTYEAGFMSFLGTKFSQEFVSSADGKVAADNLLATIRKSKEHIHALLISMLKTWRVTYFILIAWQVKLLSHT